jgi:hypothetical protein
MRVRTWVVSFVAAAVASASAAQSQSRSVELSCVNKSGENMYRAADGSVVWTASCGHESRCADATVTIGSTPNSGVIRWIGGGSCHVVNAALKSRPDGRKKRSTGGVPEGSAAAGSSRRRKS